jgi:3'-phosphoadenosine 5'-phosphosulfate sulfotransferase (PAPS reductase)/FAD synthetase
MSAMPIVVSYGGGTNSTALLILMKRRGQRPSLIMFADTGNEKPETYEHLEVMQGWCLSNDFPQITVVRNTLPQGVKDGSLYGEVYRLGTMPSKVFGVSGCSMKWKVEPQRKFQREWMRANGLGIVRHYVGYDAGEAHRIAKASRYEAPSYEVIEYPLVDADWGRDECVDAIDAEGLPRPGKSACFMCPSSRKPEVIWLAKAQR